MSIKLHTDGDVAHFKNDLGEVVVPTADGMHSLFGWMTAAAKESPTIRKEMERWFNFSMPYKQETITHAHFIEARKPS